MNSKTSCFNSTLIKSDLKRFWWASALTTLLLFLSVVIPTMDAVDRYARYYPDRTEMWRIERIQSSFRDCSYFGMFIGMGVALVLSAMLFNYLNKVNSVSCIHGLPLERRTLYFSHLASGFILILIPIVLILPFLITCMTEGLEGSQITRFFFTYLIYSLCFLTFGTFIGMLTGNSASHVIFTVIAVLLPLFITFFTTYVATQKLYGFYSSDIALGKLLEFIYIFPEKLMTYRVVIYMFYIAVFVVLGLFTYNKRGLENHGEIIAFPKLKGLFKVLVGICSGMLGYFYTVAMWNVNEIVAMIPYALIGLIIAHMLAQKSFSLRGIIPSAAVTVGIILMFAAVIRFDLTGFERRVPDVDDVESVCFTNDYVEERYYYDDPANGRSGEYLFLEVYRPVYKTPEEIKLFTDLHEYKINNRYYTENGVFYPYNSPRDFSIVYTLKNGRKLYRSYYLSAEEARTYLAPIYETETFLKFNYPILDGTEKTITNVIISDIREITDMRPEKYSGNSEEAVKLIEAIKKDRENLTYDQFLEKKQRNGNTKIRIEYTKPCVEKYGHRFTDAHLSETYYVSSYDTNTMNVLKELNYYDNAEIVKAEDITRATIHIYSAYKDGNYVDPNVALLSSVHEAVVETTYVPTQEVTKEGIVIEDAEEIRQLYDYAVLNTPIMPVTGYTQAVEINVEFFTVKNGIQYSFCKDFWTNTLTLPAFLKARLNIIDDIPVADGEITAKSIVY